MKKLILIVSLFFLGYAQSQTIIFEDDFESGDANWTLNGGTGDNTWIVNSAYAGVISPTPDQPAAITNSPNSNYLHIHSEPFASVFGAHALFDTGSETDQKATMTTSVSTSGMTDVAFSFWYLCNGSIGSYGTVEYSTDDGTTWTQLGANLSGITDWTEWTLTDAAFDNQATLKFRFGWKNDVTGEDPPLSVDQVKLFIDDSPTNTITTNTIAPASVCFNASASTSVTVPFTSTGTFTAGNIYTAQLSDATGSFASPVAIGTLASSANGTLSIDAEIPAGTPAGTGYRIRVISSTPATVGTANTVDFVVNPIATGIDVQEVCGSFTWIDGNTYTADNNTATHTIVGGAASGCDSIVTLNLTITSSFPEITASSNGSLCEGKTLNLTVTTVNGASYEWTGPDGFSSSDQNPIVFYPNAGTYEVIASSGVDCADTTQVDVIIYPLPTLNSTVSDDNCGEGIGSIIVGASSPNPPLTYAWNNGETSSTLTDLSEGIYQVTVSDDKCSIQTAYSIFNNTSECNCFIYVSNAFSPNRDGKNDFIPVRGECVSSLSFKIFNRWGNLVFETNKLNDGWDGYYKGELQNVGIYMYILEATLTDGETVSESGNITLLR